MSHPHPGNNSFDQRRLYGDLAWIWPLISPAEDYVEEAERICQAIGRYARLPVRSLLDLGCGGGHNDAALKRHFSVTGVDISPPMLSLAQSLNPEVSYLQGDMRSLRLEQRFDAVLIADSIDYMCSEEDLLAAFDTAFFHLKEGGVFITYAGAYTGEFSAESHHRLHPPSGRSRDHLGGEPLRPGPFRHYL
ncbi:MAG: class I SAM-dependent methyltransferase [Chloroflexi bacterium]|nr:class I SAM-dependent methyltransferase [Chloroflexota bacterium]